MRKRKVRLKKKMNESIDRDFTCRTKAIKTSEIDDFDLRWEQEFGDDDTPSVMSPEATMKELRKMESFK